MYKYFITFFVQIFSAIPSVKFSALIPLFMLLMYTLLLFVMQEISY